MNKFTKQIVLLAKSSIAGKLCQTSHLPFSDVKSAESYGRETFKQCSWTVAEKTIHRNLNGEFEENFRHLIPVVTPGDK